MRYMRVDGRPIFVVFAPHDLPSTAEFVAHWRELAASAGLPGLFLVAISNVFRPGVDIYRDSIYEPFDAVTPLAPQDYLDGPGRQQDRRWRRRWRELDAGRFNRLKAGRLRRPTRIDYADVVAQAMRTMPDEIRFKPSVLPNWDNTPRSSYRGVVYEGATPALFGEYLERAIRRVADHPSQQRIVFLKAWNESAEGNYVEPDTRWGHAYLDVIRAAVLPDGSVPDLEARAEKPA